MHRAEQVTGLVTDVLLLTDADRTALQMRRDRWDAALARPALDPRPDPSPSSRDRPLSHQHIEEHLRSGRVQVDGQTVTDPFRAAPAEVVLVVS